MYVTIVSLLLFFLTSGMATECPPSATMLLIFNRAATAELTEITPYNWRPTLHLIDALGAAEFPILVTKNLWRLVAVPFCAVHCDDSYVLQELLKHTFNITGDSNAIIQSYKAAAQWAARINHGAKVSEANSQLHQALSNISSNAIRNAHFLHLAKPLLSGFNPTEWSFYDVGDYILLIPKCRSDELDAGLRYDILATDRLCSFKDTMRIEYTPLQRPATALSRILEQFFKKNRAIEWSVFIIGDGAIGEIAALDTDEHFDQFIETLFRRLSINLFLIRSCFSGGYTNRNSLLRLYNRLPVLFLPRCTVVGTTSDNYMQGGLERPLSFVQNDESASRALMTIQKATGDMRVPYGADFRRAFGEIQKHSFTGYTNAVALINPTLEHANIPQFLRHGVGFFHEAAHRSPRDSARTIKTNILDRHRASLLGCLTIADDSVLVVRQRSQLLPISLDIRAQANNSFTIFCDDDEYPEETTIFFETINAPNYTLNDLDHALRHLFYQGHVVSRAIQIFIAEAYLKDGTQKSVLLRTGRTAITAPPSIVEQFQLKQREKQNAYAFLHKALHNKKALGPDGFKREKPKKLDKNCCTVQ